MIFENLEFSERGMGEELKRHMKEMPELWMQQDQRVPDRMKLRERDSATTRGRER